MLKICPSGQKLNHGGQTLVAACSKNKSPRSNFSRGGPKISRNGQKFKRGLVERMVAVVEKLLAAVKKFVDAWSKKQACRAKNRLRWSKT